jgi:hypothetical protein
MSTNTTTYPKLDPEFKAKWAEALRSGKYKQGQGELLTELNEYCCLGVAAMVLGVDKGLLRNLGTLYDRILKTEVPRPIHGSCNDNIVVSKLTSMNDTGKSFSEIADWIEENL